MQDLLVPRDVTETARQGQGIGDIEAMKQMAMKAVPEVLRMAPVTSTGMSILDAAVAAAQRDYRGAGMAALGAIPFAGALRYADDAADAVKGLQRGAEALPMDEASRMARAAEQGFTRDVYHGTNFGQPIDELRPSSDGLFGPVAYTTTSPKAAGDFAISRSRNSGGAANVLPLKAKIKNPVEIEWDGRAATANDFMSEYFPRGYKDRSDFVEQLKNQGYDGIVVRRPAPGSGEAQEYVMPLESSQLRSRFAKFDPANIGKAGLMGGLAALLAGRRTPTTQDNP
jgi:hypothetical protein